MNLEFSLKGSSFFYPINWTFALLVEIPSVNYTEVHIAQICVLGNYDKLGLFFVFPFKIYMSSLDACVCVLRLIDTSADVIVFSWIPALRSLSKEVVQRSADLTRQETTQPDARAIDMTLGASFEISLNCFHKAFFFCPKLPFWNVNIWSFCFIWKSCGTE